VASPQVEDGYTRIANELLEAIYSTRFNGTQFKILLCIIRYTYGFKRKSHNLSISFISKATGVSKRYISAELSRLIDNKVIAVLQEHTDTTSRVLALNKNYKQWTIGGTGNHQMNNTSTGEPTQHTTDEELFNTTDEELFNTTDEELFTQERKYKENIKDNIKENIIVLTPIENEILETLSMVKNYPIDREKDLDMIKRLEERYPQLDLVESIKDWATYKLDKPLKPKDNPRSQINTSCKNYVKWGKNLKGVKLNGTDKGSNRKSKYSEEQLKKFRAF